MKRKGEESLLLASWHAWSDLIILGDLKGDLPNLSAF